MSTPIRTPSRTTLADGRIAFIIYRRDAANSAPDRVTVRVIAKIMRSMTFATAGPVTTRVEIRDHPQSVTSTKGSACA